MKKNRTVFKIGDFISADVACAAATYTKVGSYTVLAGEIIFLGYGDDRGQDGSLGRIYGEIKETGTAAMTGTLRFVLETAQDMPIKVLAEYDLAQLTTSSTDRRQQVPCPELDDGGSEDKKIVVYVKSDAAHTLDVSASTLVFDATRYYTD